MVNDAPLHPDVEELTRLVPPPVHPIGVADDHLWQKAEALAHAEYPVERIQVNPVYGSGFIDDLLWILNPAPQIDAYNLFTYGADRDIATAGIKPVLPTVTAESLLPVAWTTAGHELFHVTSTERSWKL